LKPDEVVKSAIKWLRNSRITFVNARVLARKFNVSTFTAGKVLRYLRELGLVEVYRVRRGRFLIYRVRSKRK
jgi:HTH domain.